MPGGVAWLRALPAVGVVSLTIGVEVPDDAQGALTGALPVDPDWPEQHVKFVSSMRLREMLPITLRIAIFNLLTLTAYRFWARTQVRKYIWSRTQVLDEPVEYTGSALELFLGFAQILVFAHFAPCGHINLDAAVRWAR